MASTYSNLKFELIGTGEQVGTWGNTTNTNLGTAIEQAIVGTASVSFSSADVTLTLTNTNAAQNARALRLNLTGTSGGARNLILGSGCQIDKPYIVNNGLADTVTVKNTTGTGVAVPAGKTMWVYNNGTNVVDAVTHLSSLTLGSALPIASGGTGSTSTTFVNLATNVTGTLPIANGGTGSTSTTFVNLATNVTGTLPIANGGTGLTATPTNGQIDIGNGTGFTRATLTAGTGISITNGTGSISIAATNNGTVTSVSGTGTVQGLTLSGTVTSSGSLTLGGSLSAVSLSSQVSGTLPIANGGTGQTTYTNGQLLIGNTTGGTLVKATLTASTGISITNGAGSISIAATNNGTVTSVSGTGTINGVTLSGTVTSTGNITLGGAINASTINTGTLPVARGGTGLTTVGTSGNVLTSNGSAWVSQAISAGGNYILRTYASPATWTKPANLKAVRVTVVGGGGVWRTSVPQSPTFTAAGSSSFGPFVSATGGANATGAGNANVGSGGAGSGGDINITGGIGYAMSTDFAQGGGTIFATNNGRPGFSPTGPTSYRVAGENGAGSYAVLGGNFGGAGGGGGSAIKYLSSPSIPGPVTVTVGAGGTTSGPAPALPERSPNGGNGVVIVEEFY
jgi:fibronectin-binding autotransporter adhesin